VWVHATDSLEHYSAILKSVAPGENNWPMSELGKLLVVVGLVIAAGGLLLWLGMGRTWLGQLPGDINYSRGNFTFHFPLMTCLLLSVILTVVVWLFRK
jgi:hypothetical protein